MEVCSSRRGVISMKKSGLRWDVRTMGRRYFLTGCTS